MNDIYEIAARQAIYAITVTGMPQRLDVSSFPADVDQLAKRIVEKGYRAIVERFDAVVAGKPSQQIIIECWLDSKHRHYPVIPS